MILVDMNQVMISNLMVSISMNPEIEEGLVRHMVLNSIRSYRKKFVKDFGELVLCYDSKSYWRRKQFQFYKGTRKKDRENSSVNWNRIFEVLNKIKDEMSQSLPYKIMEVDGAEADDVIAVLCKEQCLVNIRLQNNMQPPEKILILSGDKDFIQLQKYPFVTQYNPIQKKWVTGVDPHQYIAEHVLKGDRSDGIPNFLSPDETFVKQQRQRPLSKKNLAKWIEEDPENFCDEKTIKFFERNQMLINFDYIPSEVHESIIDTYDTLVPNKRGLMYPYFAKHELNELLNDIGDF